MKNATQHPTPWAVGEKDRSNFSGVFDADGHIVGQFINRELAHDVVAKINRYQDMEDMVWMQANSWGVRPSMLYDEEGVEGWTWCDPQDRDHSVIGNHSDGPVIDDQIREYVRKCRRHCKWEE
jgi:hypothetical protein